METPREKCAMRAAERMADQDGQKALGPNWNWRAYWQAYWRNFWSHYWQAYNAAPCRNMAG
jgi:hypothetical protein